MHWFLLGSSRNLDLNLLLFASSKQNNIRSLLIFLLRVERETKLPVLWNFFPQTVFLSQNPNCLCTIEATIKFLPLPPLS